MKNLAIVVRDDGMDQMLTPLVFAYTQAKEGVKVDMLFTLWSVRSLTEAGVNSLTVDGHHAKDRPELENSLDKLGYPKEIRTYFQMLQKTGNANLYGCKIAASVFGVNESNLLPEASGIVDPGWFLKERASKADHCQYF
jgi:peroxiredoxin family protein